MADPRFFQREGPFDLASLAALIGAELSPGADPAMALEDVAPLDLAEPHHLSFLDNRKYLEAFTQSRAGACVVRPSVVRHAPDTMALLLTEQPYKAYALAASAFYPIPAPAPGVHVSALVDPSADVASDCRIEAGVVIGPGVRLGPRSVVGANSVIDAGVQIGAEARIGPCVSISHALIGDRVAIYAGARIGQDGFGFAPDPKGHQKVPQLGRAVIHDDVEVGANTTIDRGSGPDTVIGAGCWIDNLVQIGHNVELGKGCVIAGQAGVSGSTKLGDFVFLGGQAGLAGHLTIGAGARVAAQGGVMRDLDAGGDYCGAPAVPVRTFFRQVAALTKLAENKGGD